MGNEASEAKEAKTSSRNTVKTSTCSAAVAVGKAMLRLLDCRERFCIGALARSRTGEMCEPHERGARAWSLDGALERVDAPLPAKSEIEEAMRHLARIPLTRFSDERGYAATRQLIGEAMDLLQRRKGTT